MKTNYEDIETRLSSDNNVLTVKLFRPEAYNALSPLMLAELMSVFKYVNHHKEIRAIILKGSGKSFCAGADLNRMRNVARRFSIINYYDSLRLGRLFRTMEKCNVPIIANVHGSVYGGGIGLMAACDHVVIASNASFRFSEVRLGIAPSNILKYVVQRIGVFKAYDLMVTAAQFDAEEAEKMGLADRIVDEELLDETVEKWIEHLLKAAPEAVHEIKRLKYRFLNGRISIHNAARSLAKIRATANGKEGLKAFFDKRRPRWKVKK